MPATPEWMFLGILALILFGPKKLPTLAKGFGKFMAELQKAKEEFRREILNIPALPTIKEPQEKKAYQPTAVANNELAPSNESNRLLSKLASADEVQGVHEAQKSEHIDIGDASSTGATQQFVAEVEFRKKSNIRYSFCCRPIHLYSCSLNA